jgi:hypothetical protein
MTGSNRERSEDSGFFIPPVSDWIVPKVIVRTDSLRAGMLADVQLVCGAGPFELDVLVRSLERRFRLEFQGQVTHAERIHEPVISLPLWLVEADATDPVDRSNTDEFGEFGFASSCDGRYGLRLGEGGDAPCVLVWEGGQR